jgi:hypothetical protein
VPPLIVRWTGGGGSSLEVDANSKNGRRAWKTSVMEPGVPMSIWDGKVAPSSWDWNIVRMYVEMKMNHQIEASK